MIGLNRKSRRWQEKCTALSFLRYYFSSKSLTTPRFVFCVCVCLFVCFFFFLFCFVLFCFFLFLFFCSLTFSFFSLLFQLDVEPDYVTQVENHIPDGIKFSYVVTDKKTWEYIGKHRPNVTISLYYGESKENNRRITDLSRFKQFGAKWLDEVISCPKPIRTTLEDRSMIHHVCVLSRDPKHAIQNILGKDRRGISTIYTPEKVIEPPSLVTLPQYLLVSSNYANLISLVPTILKKK